MDGFIEQQRNAVACLQALIEEVARRLIGPAVELAKSEGSVFRDHRQLIGARSIAALFEEMMQPLAFFPANRVGRIAGEQAAFLPALFQQSASIRRLFVKHLFPQFCVNRSRHP